MNNEVIYPQFRIPVKVFYDETKKKILLRADTEIEIANCDIDNYNEEDVLRDKIYEILNDPDEYLNLVSAIDKTGNIIFYDSSRIQTELYEVEIERKFLKENIDSIDIIKSRIKNKLKEGLIKIESRLIIPILDN